MTEILVHDVPKGRLPSAAVAGAVLQLFPASPGQTTSEHQQNIAPRNNRELVILGMENGEVTAAAVGVVSDEISVVRLSLLRGTSPEAVLGVVGALVEQSKQLDTINTVFADGIVTARSEALLAYAGFNNASIPHYRMPAGMSKPV